MITLAIRRFHIDLKAEVQHYLLELDTVTGLFYDLAMFSLVVD